MNYPSNIEYVEQWMQNHPTMPFFTIRKGKDTVLSHKENGYDIDGAIQLLKDKLFLLSEGNYKITLYTNGKATVGGVTTDLTIGSVMPQQNNKTMSGFAGGGGWVTASEAEKMVLHALEKKENELLRERILKLEMLVEKNTETIKDIQKSLDKLFDDDESNDLSGEELISSAGEKVKAASEFLEAMKTMKEIKF